jgi:integrase
MTKEEILGNLGILLLDIVDKSSSALLLYKQLNKTDNGSCIIRVLDNDIIHNDFTGGRKGGEIVPPKYADGSFRQLKYCLEYKFMHLGKRISVYGKTKDICWNKRTAIIAGKKAEKPIAKTMTVGELLECHLSRKKAHKPPLSVSAIENIERCIRLHIGANIKAISLNKLKPYDLEKALNDITSSRMREYTYTVFSGALSWAKANGLIQTEIWKLIDREKHISESYRPLEDAEYELLISKADAELRRYIIGYCWTGCRRNELLSITYSNIDNDSINIYDKKTKKWKRVPIFPPLAEIIGQGEGKPFPRSASWVNENLRKLCDSLGLNDISTHSLRNTFGSVLYDNGVDIKDIQAWLGHSTLKVTQDIYTKRRKKSQNDAIKGLIDKMFKSDSTTL